MGASILLIFLAPIMVISMLIDTLFGTPLALNKAEIILPYDSEKGIVWEYDNKDDPYIELVSTEINGNEQVFTFGITSKNWDTEGAVMELIFTDKNGNQEIFYGCRGVLFDHGNLFRKPYFYNPDDCITFEYTVTAEEPVAFGKWEINNGIDYIVRDSETNGDSKTYTVVYIPGKTTAPNNEMYLSFYYSDSLKKREKQTVIIEKKFNKLEIKSENHEVY